MLSTFRTLGDALKFFTGLEQQQSAQNTHTHSTPLPSPHQQYSRGQSLIQKLLFFHICRHIHQVAPLGLEGWFHLSRVNNPACVLALLLPFHLQFTEVPQKSDPCLLGLLIPLDPQSTWCYCGVTKHPLPALGVCQSLEAQNKLSTG